MSENTWTITSIMVSQDDFRQPIKKLISTLSHWHIWSLGTIYECRVCKMPFNKKHSLNEHRKKDHDKSNKEKKQSRSKPKITDMRSCLTSMDNYFYWKEMARFSELNIKIFPTVSALPVSFFFPVLRSSMNPNSIFIEDSVTPLTHIEKVNFLMGHQP